MSFDSLNGLRLRAYVTHLRAQLRIRANASTATIRFKRMLRQHRCIEIASHEQLYKAQDGLRTSVAKVSDLSRAMSITHTCFSVLSSPPLPEDGFCF